MSYALVASVANSLGGTGGTTTAIDTTSANLIVIALSFYSSNVPTLSDSKSNTWTALTTQGAAPAIRLYYSYAPTVGAGHTFTVSGSGIYATLEVLAFSGAVSAPFDLQSGTSGSGTTVAPGSVTPSQANEVVVYAAAGDPAATSDWTSVSVGTLQAHLAGLVSTYYSTAIGYSIQTTATAINPTFTNASSQTASAAALASFKAAAGGVLIVTAAPGVLTWAGLPSPLSTILAATPGAYSWNGPAASLSLLVGATPGSYSWAGSSSNLSILLSVGVGAWSWTGTTASFTQSVSQTSGAYSWAGTPAGIVSFVGQTPATWSWSGLPSTIALGKPPRRRVVLVM